MKLNISRLRKEIGAAEEFNFSIPALAEIDGTSFNEPVKVQGQLANIGERLQLAAHVRTQITRPCDRCLDAVETAFEFEFVEDYCHREDCPDAGSEENEIIVLETEIIDLAQAVQENIILNLPMRMLCVQDCPGLCPHCGQRLKDKKCSCKADAVDPRLAALANWKTKDD